MKITTQRTLLWGVNILLVVGLLGFVALMAKSKPVARKRVRAKTNNMLMEALRQVKPPAPTKVGNQKEATLRTPFDPSFHFAGFIAPPKPKPVGPSAPKGPPELKSLIDIVWLMAPPRKSTEAGPIDMDGPGVSVRIKGLPNNKNIFWYKEGQVIGTGTAVKEDRYSDLEQHQGARLLRVLPDGIVCQWAGKEERVLMSENEDIRGVLIKGRRIAIGSDQDGSGSRSADAASAVDNEGAIAQFRAGRGNLDNVTITQNGWEQFQVQGDKILDGVTFDSGKDADGREALKIKSLPANLRNLGLQDGDVVIRIDSTPVTSKASIVNYVKRTHKSKPRYNVTILRDGQQRSLNVQVPRNLKEAQKMGNRNIRFGERGSDRGSDRSRKR